MTVCNLGADFSDFGHSVLLRKSRHDQELALTVWCRADLPREILAKLFMDASESVRNLFATREPEKVELIRDVVASASSQTLTQRATPTRYIEALAVVEPLHRSGQLSEEHLEKFAKAGHFERVAIALSRMSEVSTDLIERALTQSRAEQFLVIAKAINLSWDTTKTILSSRIMSKIISDAEIEQAFISFTRLQRKTAKTALQFYRLRARATVSL